MKDNKKGFSLVEIIVAISILALVSVGIVGGFTFSQNLTKTNALRDEKAASLQEAAEFLIVEGNLAGSLNQFINRAESDYGYVYVADGDFDSTVDQVQFTATSNYLSGDLTQVTAVMYFDSPKGRDKAEFVFFVFPERMKGRLP